MPAKLSKTRVWHYLHERLFPSRVTAMMHMLTLLLTLGLGAWLTASELAKTYKKANTLGSIIGIVKTRAALPIDTQTRPTSVTNDPFTEQLGETRAASARDSVPTILARTKRSASHAVFDETADGAICQEPDGAICQEPGGDATRNLGELKVLAPLIGQLQVHALMCDESLPAELRQEDASNHANAEAPPPPSRQQQVEVVVVSDEEEQLAAHHDPCPRAPRHWFREGNIVWVYPGKDVGPFQGEIVTVGSPSAPGATGGEFVEVEYYIGRNAYGRSVGPNGQRTWRQGREREVFIERRPQGKPWRKVYHHHDQFHGNPNPNPSQTGEANVLAPLMWGDLSHNVLAPFTRSMADATEERVFAADDRHAQELADLLSRQFAEKAQLIEDGARHRLMHLPTCHRETVRQLEMQQRNERALIILPNMRVRCEDHPYEDLPETSRVTDALVKRENLAELRASTPPQLVQGPDGVYHMQMPEHMLALMQAVTRQEVQEVARGERQPRLSDSGAQAAMQGADIPESAELSDNGATAGVQRTLQGAIPGTRRVDTTGGFKIGNNTTLPANYTYLCAFWRIGADGHRRAKIERRYHMPTALCTIGSEPQDVYMHNERYTFDSENGRVNFGADGTAVKLFMSPNGLGWYKTEPITEPEVLRTLLQSTNEQPVMNVPQAMARGSDATHQPDEDKTRGTNGQSTVSTLQGAAHGAIATPSRQ